MKPTHALLLLVFPLVIVSCCKDNESDLVNHTLYSENDAQREIIRTITTNISTGIGDVFDVYYPDSSSRTAFCREFTHTARFMNEGSGYVFVETTRGYNIAHPANPSLQGTSTIDQTDANGKPIVEEMINTVEHIGYGFLEYYYQNPASQSIEQKTTYVCIIPGTSWYCGSGYYNASNEPLYLAFDIHEKVAREGVIAMSEGIGAILANHTGDSLAKVEFMRTFLKHIRFFDDQSGYYYVLDFNGYNVVQPPDPSIQGTYEWDIQDAKGNYLVRGLVQTAQEGGGTYSYYWIDYQTNEEKLKTAYVRQIPGTNYLIGTGIYSKE